MTRETLTIKNALIARLIAAKLAAIKTGGGDVRRICPLDIYDRPSRQISNATVE
jgi:hypothetical protein